MKIAKVTLVDNYIIGNTYLLTLQPTGFLT